MSGSLVQLVSIGIQDTFLIDAEGESFFRSRFTKHTNFTQTPKQLEIVGQVTSGAVSMIPLDGYGDLLNYVWLEGTNIVDNLSGTKFDLVIGGQVVDTQSFEFCSDVWQIYLAETKAKADAINNKVSQSDKNFFPFHFFFCDNAGYLPLIALQHHKAEIRIRWGPIAPSCKCFGNYVYLDTDERNKFVNAEHEMVIQQVQVASQTVTSGSMEVDLKLFNHPVKALFFGFPAKSSNPANDYFTFDDAQLYLNGNVKFEGLSPHYFHTVQGYHHTTNGIINFNNTYNCPFYTRFYVYSFGRKINDSSPNGTCNFSRIDNVKLMLNNVSVGSSRTNDLFYVFAVNFNVLKIKDGCAGVMFSN